MKGRVGGSRGGNGGAPANLLIYLPYRARTTSTAKPICGPSRPTGACKRHSARPASLLFKTRCRDMSSEIDEPTSPKVTCAGQIKVRTKSRSRCRPSRSGSADTNQLSGVEGIERLHRQRKRPHWLVTLGLKKDIMHFIGALRGLRLRLNTRWCFGSFRCSVDCTADEEDGGEYEEEEEEEDKEVETSAASKTIFSEWVMLLEENQGVGCKTEAKEEEEVEDREDCSALAPPPSPVPPPNALLLMRCRSAPAKGWLKGGGEERGGEGQEVAAKMIKEEVNKKERLVRMSCASHFFKISMEIAKETWVAGSMDPLARSRSWSR